MAESKIQGAPIIYKEETKRSVSIPSNTYYINTSAWFPTTPSGYTFAFAVMMMPAFSGNEADVPVLQGDGVYMYGTPGKTYNTIRVRYFYILS